MDNKLPGYIFVTFVALRLYRDLYGKHFVTSFVEIFTEMPDRTNGVPLLPLSTRDKDGRLKEEKDSRLKEEFHKLLNGNHGDPTDRVL